MSNELNKSDNLLKEISLNSKSIDSQKTNFLSRIIETIKNTFFQAPKTVLTGKTQEQQKYTHKVLANLLHIKTELKGKINSELFTHVEKAIDPISRDAKRIQKMMATAITKDDTNKTQIKYRQWIEKAERWMAIGKNLDSQISVIEAIIEQHFSEAEEQIDHDLQLIEDYETHTLSSLSLPPEKKEQLTKIIRQNLSIHVNELMKLKEKPETVDLYKINRWKSELTSKRTHHFENALHKIDSMIEQISPLLNNDEETNPELELLEFEANTLEKEAIEVLSNEVNQGAVDPEHKNSLRLRFQWLQQKAHPHHLDHHLSSSQGDRLDKISSAIERINKDIAQF